MSDIEKASQRGIIAYFANNTVAANLLMVFILIMGFISYMTIQRQMFPNFENQLCDGVSRVSWRVSSRN